MNCPHCGFENIEGADVCEECQQPIDFLSQPVPKSQIERSLLKDRIQILRPSTPVSVTPETTCSQVLTLLTEKSLGCVLVVKADQLVGIFSERDALFRLNTTASEFGDRPISEFMTPNPETLKASDKIAFALHKMDVGGYRHIPLVDDTGKVDGIISVRDILGYITDDLLADVSS